MNDNSYYTMKHDELLLVVTWGKNRDSPIDKRKKERGDTQTAHGGAE
jgi:hypothetical protein